MSNFIHKICAHTSNNIIGTFWGTPCFRCPENACWMRHYHTVIYLIVIHHCFSVAVHALLMDRQERLDIHKRSSKYSIWSFMQILVIRPIWCGWNGLMEHYQPKTVYSVICEKINSVISKKSCGYEAHVQHQLWLVKYCMNVSKWVLFLKMTLTHV